MCNADDDLALPVMSIGKEYLFYQKNNVEVKKRYLANDLAFEALQTKYKFCRDVSEGLSYDESFFLKRQLEWLGMEYTPEWWNS